MKTHTGEKPSEKTAKDLGKMHKILVKNCQDSDAINVILPLNQYI